MNVFNFGSKLDLYSLNIESNTYQYGLLIIIILLSAFI